MSTTDAGASPVERGVRPAGRPARRLTTKQKRMQKAIRFMANYMGTYEAQAGSLDYRDTTLIDDVLYALGYALGGDEHKFADGYDRWKVKLRKHLAEQA